MTGSARLLTVLAVGLLTASIALADDSKLLGQWERKVGKSVVSLTFTDDNRLHFNFSGDEAVKLHADYHVTRHGVVYGVVTSAEVSEETDTDEAKLSDVPFSFRFRVDEGVLIVRDFKSHNEDWTKSDILGGRFRPVSATAPARPVANSPSSMPPLPPLAPPPQRLEPQSIPVPAEPMAISLPSPRPGSSCYPTQQSIPSLLEWRY
jgi:hypothetical protein